MDPILISVIIPAYNCAATISQTINSVLMQTVPLEILVIDDCSKDNTPEVLQPYIERDQIRYFRNEKNLGASGSRNKGVSLAKGDYIAFVDSDDWWEAEKLTKQLQRMEETGCVLCSTARELMHADGSPMHKTIPVKEMISYRDMLHQNMINCSSVLVRKDVIEKYPMEHEDSHEDYITWLKILQEYGFACAVNEPLLKYRLSLKGKSGGKLKSARMTFLVYRYMGFSWLKSIYCFCCYAINGVLKYR